MSSFYGTEIMLFLFLKVSQHSWLLVIDDYRTIQYCATQVDLINLQVGINRLLVDCWKQLNDQVLRGYQLQQSFRSRFHEMEDEIKMVDHNITFFTRPNNPTFDHRYLLVVGAGSKADDDNGAYPCYSGQPALSEEVACTTIRSPARGAKRCIAVVIVCLLEISFAFRQTREGTADVDVGLENYRDFLFVADGKVVTSSIFSKDLYSYLREYTGAGLGLQAYRHVATFFMRHYLQ
ncbi:hypothetical protein BDB00DRAFT_872792 [Zychaea mexicana]|uniref:uncharacterized protein n=1 Tax=Zychaea mexicana TaxID=64656 RepID=UPI0022FE3404|nr:uncharacterized protein BDB00DRAFT_872792 [Zychaea mexicana]KAI9493073.1 hypothetical protein BDB00DRAFT_872792 [Zychaea mexicana]